MNRRLLVICLACTLTAPAAAAVPQAARMTQCGLPRADVALGADSFTDLWRASTLGLTGGDAALSARLPDGRVLWAFGDSFIGGLRPDGTRPSNSPVVRNTLVIQAGNCLTTLFRGGVRHPSAYLPAPEDPYRGWYWPNQPLVRGDKVLMFMTHLHRTGPDGWGFVPDGTALATLRLPDLRLMRLQRVHVAARAYFGVTAIPRGGATYVFGVDERDGGRGLLVARVRDSLERGRWAFWTGVGWSRLAARARPVLNLPSSQFSVIRLGRRLVLAVKDGMGGAVLAFAAASPTGPWTAEGTLAWIPPLPGLLTYNSALHEEFATGSAMLLSYSVNCTDPTFDEVNEKPWHYLPRFTLVHLPAPVAGS